MGLPARWGWLEMGLDEQAGKKETPMTAQSMLPWDLRSEDLGEDTRVYFTGRDVSLDETNTGVIGERLSRLVEERGRIRLVLDMSNVSYLTSSSLGMLLHLHRKLQSASGRLAIANVQPQIYEIFAVTNLTRLLDVRPAGAKKCAT
jgi:anti-anti-sigma factor